jgi:hypothetical protein
MERIIRLGMMAVETQDQVNADFEFKKRIGVHIESLIRKKLIDSNSIKWSIHEYQGGQDIIICLNDKIVYYIEVKSRWNINSSILMSNAQIKNAVTNKQCYALCSVEMSDYWPEDHNRYEVPDIQFILDRITFVSNIGEKLEPLIINALSVEASESDVKLTDEYRAIIPQLVIKTGMSIGQFAQALLTQLTEMG